MEWSNMFSSLTNKQKFQFQIIHNNTIECSVCLRTEQMNCCSGHIVAAFCDLKSSYSCFSVFIGHHSTEFVVTDSIDFPYLFSIGRVDVTYLVQSRSPCLVQIYNICTLSTLNPVVFNDTQSQNTQVDAFLMIMHVYFWWQPWSSTKCKIFTFKSFMVQLHN